MAPAERIRRLVHHTRLGGLAVYFGSLLSAGFHE
jgi:hypothetical protein